MKTKIILVFCALLLASGAALAQTGGASSSGSLQKGAWEFAPIIGGGDGLGHASNTQFLYAGGRVGWVLTGEHLPGWLRGDFEWAGDFMPVYTVFAARTPFGAGGAIYGASMKPIIWQWNFTSHRRVAPYAAIAGGVLFSTRNLPPGNTSSVNFTPQGAFGVHIFLRNNRALLLEMAVVHHSNASLGTQNPGYNAALFFTVGYSWFRRP